MKIYFNKKNSQIGFSMVELMLTFAIILGLAAMVFYIYPKVKDNQITLEEATGLTTLQAAIKTLYQTKASYSSISAQLLIDANVVPMNMVSGNEITNRWRNSVTVSPATLSGNAVNNAFSLTYTGVSQAACAKLAISLGDSFDVISVGGVDVKTFGTTSTDEALAASQCAAGGPNVSMVLTSL